MPVGDPGTKTAVEESNIRDMIHFMNAGAAAEALILSSDETKGKIVSAVMDILKCDNPSIQHGAISKALFSGCAIVSIVSNVLRVPTKEDVAARVEATNARKKPRFNGVGERQSVAKILNCADRLEKGSVYEQAKHAELETKEAKETGKLERRRVEFPLLPRCRELGLTQIIPDSKAGHQYSLLKSELIVLCAKLALEADCKKIYKRKHNSLNRTELGDYLLTKLKDTEHIGAILETPIETDPTADYESWETINEFLHGKFGSGDAIAESEPSQADKLSLDNFYSNRSADDQFLVNSSWYMHPQFRIVS